MVSTGNFFLVYTFRCKVFQNFFITCTNDDQDFPISKSPRKFTKFVDRFRLKSDDLKCGNRSWITTPDSNPNSRFP